MKQLQRCGAGAYGLCIQGLWPNYVKVVPSIAIAFVTYEQVRVSYSPLCVQSAQALAVHLSQL